MRGTRQPSSVPHKHVSIEDVAQAASVSTATVSRVINNPELVAPATATRVQQAIRALDYRPNPFAKGLSTKRSNVLGIALPDIFGEFYSELLRGADAEARRLGYHLLISSEASLTTRGVGNRQSETGLGFGIVDGLAVMITEPDEALMTLLSRAQVPLVVLDIEPHGSSTDTIVVDNTTGTREATLHLLASAPPSKCFFVGGPRENFDTADRAKAFSAVLQAQGHAPRPDQVCFGAYTMEWGQRWAQTMLQQSRADLPGWGVLAGNDEIAYGVMASFQDAGLDVPRDIRLVGFDDTRLASIVRPRLSTVRMPAPEIGAAAVRTLADRIGNPNAVATHLRLPSHLIIRESSVPFSGRG